MIPRGASFLLGAALCCLSSTGCRAVEDAPDAAPQDPSFSVVIAVAREDGKGLPGTAVLVGNRVVGTTDAEGKAKLSLNGQEGSTALLTIQCPDGFATPSKPLAVGLRHLAPGSPPPRFEQECVRLTHTIVVGIRAENGANLPILRLSQVVGRTDMWGAAHVPLETATGEQVTLKLDTSANPDLRPESPTLTFVATDKEELVLLEQKFTVLKKVVHRVIKQRPKPL